MSTPTGRVVIPPGRPGAGERSRLAEVIADDLRSLIVRTAGPGDVLPAERELIEVYGVSRPVVREALMILETEGLLRVRQGARSGPVVQRVSLEVMTRTFGVYLQQRGVTLRDLFGTRCVLEPAAARLAASAPAPDLGELERILEREAAVLDRGQWDLADTEVAFHRALLDLPGQHTLASLGHLLDSVVARHAVQNQGLVDERGADPEEAARAAHRAHRRIADAIRAGDADAAERRVTRHLRAVLETMPLHPDGPASIFGPRPGEG